MAKKLHDEPIRIISETNELRALWRQAAAKGGELPLLVYRLIGRELEAARLVDSTEVPFHLRRPHLEALTPDLKDDPRVREAYEEAKRLFR